MRVISDVCRGEPIGILVFVFVFSTREEVFIFEGDVDIVGIPLI